MRPLPGPRTAPAQQSQRASRSLSQKTIGFVVSGAGLLLTLAWLSTGPSGESASSPLISAAQAEPVSQPAPKPFDDGYRQTVQPFLTKYCADCHSEGVEIADVDFDRFPDDASLEPGRHTFEKVIKLVRVGAMPPDDHPDKPTPAEREAVADWLHARLFEVDCEIVQDPGRVTIRRLNRAEYDNTIRDLVGIDFSPAADFPSDDVGEGFDNNGDVLTLPPLLLEKYLDAAEEIASRAISLTPSNASKTTTIVAGEGLKGSGASERGEWMVMSSTGEVRGNFQVTRDGKYDVTIRAQADQAGDEPARMEVRVDGKAVKTIDVTGSRKPREYTLQTRLAKGERTVTARFVNDYYNPKAKDRNRRDRNLYVGEITLAGPVDAGPPEFPEVHNRIVSVRPSSGVSPEEAARRSLSKWMPKAWRRPVTDTEVAQYARLVEFVTKQGDSYERGMQVAVAAVLVSPQFLFRAETDPDPNDPQASRTLGDYELASRLSYFLWSSMPDDRLLELAERGELKRTTVLEAEVRRMLADPKAQSLVENFASQWLNLRNLDEAAPDRKQFSFNEPLREAMKTETRLLFEHVLTENRPSREFLTADYTFVNQRLAEHYGLSNVEGDKFRKVPLVGTPRRGVLTHASILTLTSNPSGTSPVKRGKWILDNILDDSPPEPPADVPDLETAQKSNPDLPLKEQLAAHRENGTCASCHKTMDQLGFAFENFDAVGRWRTKDGKHDIDPSGTLPGGESFGGPVELIGILRDKEVEFVQTLTRRLLVFALGRGLEPFDHCAVDEILKRGAAHDYRLQDLIVEVCLSRPFRMRRGEEPQTD